MIVALNNVFGGFADIEGGGTGGGSTATYAGASSTYNGAPITYGS